MLNQTNVKKQLPLMCLVAMWITIALGCSLSKSFSKSSAVDPEAQKKHEKRKALEDKTAQLATIPAKVQLVKEASLKGKLAFYTQAGGTWYLENFSDLYHDQPYQLKDLFAQAPDEVGTIALIPDCQLLSIGNYQVSAGYTLPGYIEKCELTLVDPAISAVVYRKQFAGKVEKEVKVDKGQNKIVGSVPRAEIYDFLTSLPHK